MFGGLLNSVSADGNEQSKVKRNPTSLQVEIENGG